MYHRALNENDKLCCAFVFLVLRETLIQENKKFVIKVDDDDILWDENNNK